MDDERPYARFILVRGRLMTIANPPKALILLVALLSLVLLMAIGKVDTDSGMPILTAIVFYGIGNGVAARNGNPSQPIIGSKNDQQ